MGFSSGQSSFSDTSTQSDLADDKLKKMSFVKASMIHDTLESVKYDDQNVSKLNQKGNFGIGYAEPENSKPSWLTNRLDKDRTKSGSQLSDLHQQRRSSVKVTDLCCSDLIVAAGVVIISQKLVRMRGRAAIPHSHLPAGLLALMRRVVNYHSSWVGQQQVELLMHLVFRCGVKMSG
ncbi:hypothetical protein F511_15612 [Dorcoceras hygrometricum]|uniref:Uncharacterized protein n=1 Tax=Dorcoceras hygrometricum TaxID=472368 RepID=A0A2Z7AI64_9LAMI|nr:hypothetical protein F511_15612 [Dorcoceras hygrometricum]